jgi:molybdate-binding protein
MDPQTGAYNETFLGPENTPVRGWTRMQGVIFRKGNRRFEGQSVENATDAALAEANCHMVNRNQGAGTRILIDRLLGAARPSGYWNQPKSHNAAAAAVAQGRADWGVRSNRSRAPTCSDFCR